MRRTVTGQFKPKATSPMLIRLAQYQFHLSEPFAEGHRLSADEARVLNAYRADSIAKNVKRRFDETVRQSPAPDGLLSEEGFKAFSDYLLRYDEDYTIGKGFRSPKPGAIEADARRIAAARLPDTASKAEIEVFALRPEILEEARRRLTERATIVAAGIDDLIS